MPFANCGVICLYKYLRGPEVMRGDVSCWSSTWLYCTQTETSAHMLWALKQRTRRSIKCRVVQQRDTNRHTGSNIKQTHRASVLSNRTVFKDTVQFLFFVFSRKVSEDLLSSKVIPPHIHPSLSMPKCYCHRLFSVKSVTALSYSPVRRQRRRFQQRYFHFTTELSLGLCFPLFTPVLSYGQSGPTSPVSDCFQNFRSNFCSKPKSTE